METTVSTLGLAIVCEACESEIDFPDEYADLGICRHCGIAFLVDAGQTRERGARARQRGVG